MPNHVTNILTIEGPEELVAKARALVISEKGEVDFELIAPMPEILRTIHTGFITIGDEKVEMWTEDEEGNPCKLNEKEKQAVALYGDWYNWSVSVWGTKWNAYDCDILEDSPGQLKVKFDTAWASPHGWFGLFLDKFLSEKVIIDLSWADEDFGNNTGILRYFGDREIIQVHHYPNGSLAAHNLAVEVKGYNPAEEYPEDYEGWEFRSGEPEIKEYPLGIES
jgi:hypothetical protein